MSQYAKNNGSNPLVCPKNLKRHLETPSPTVPMETLNHKIQNNHTQSAQPKMYRAVRTHAREEVFLVFLFVFLAA
jgi:hypothetical protein